MPAQALSSLPTRIDDSRLDPARVSRAAVAVIDGLRDAGFDAYLVGGCVRDLLLGRTPKDFDIASDATPEEVREVFPRVRVVGRRFRIAHVRIRREVIEVSTFRRALDEGDGRRPVVSSEGVILRDNAYGAIHEDAFRRDFTANALYYDPIGHVLLDYCDGLKDLEARTLRAIGDPETRFREDPVRILRAVRFATKLDLTLHAETRRAIAPTRAMLDAIPPARLFDEFGKLFMGGAGERTFEALQQHDLMSHLVPLSEDGGDLARLALANTDQRIREGKPVTPGFLLAAFLWPEFVHRTETAGPRQPTEEQLDSAAMAVLAAQQSTLAIPRRHAYFVREVWRLQPALAWRTAKNVPRVLAHRRFRAAYDFLLLRSEVDEEPSAGERPRREAAGRGTAPHNGELRELADWWTEAQTLDADDLAQRLPRERSPRRRRRRYAHGNRRKSNPMATANGAAAAP
ncbi:MAG: polynucleotide adenylyltransferase PcnB [Gammaproteobacteria bacterium]|nr:polynucleotide adenylyltransferase PcnB [Gammaproteobacteria bacterium]